MGMSIWLMMACRYLSQILPCFDRYLVVCCQVKGLWEWQLTGKGPAPPGVRPGPSYPGARQALIMHDVSAICAVQSLGSAARQCSPSTCMRISHTFPSAAESTCNLLDQLKC